MTVSLNLNSRICCSLALSFIFVIELEGSRLLQQQRDYTAKNAFEDVQNLITMPTGENASQILLDYYQSGNLKQFIQGSGQLLDQGGVIGLIAVRRLAGGLSDATQQQPEIVQLFLTATAASNDTYADAYIQVFEALFRDFGCQVFGPVSDAVAKYFISSQSQHLGECAQNVEQESANVPIQSVEEVVAAFQSTTGASDGATIPLAELPSSAKATVPLVQESSSILPEAPPQPEIVINDEDPPLPANLTGEIDESMVSMISVAHNSNEAASIMMIEFLDVGKQTSVAASIAQAIKNGHAEAALEALGDTAENGTQCSDIQQILSSIAMNLSDLGIDQLAQHARSIPDIQRCLGQGIDSCIPTQAAACCSISGPTNQCRLIYAEENSIPSLGLSVFRNSAGTELCQCPASS